MTEEIRLTTEVLNCDYFNRNRGFNCYKGKNCTEVPDCYYRQLKRLEQKNKDFEILAKNLYKKIEELEKENEALAFRERLYKADYEASEQENKELKKQIESDKGLITVGGKQQYEYLQRIDELEQENKALQAYKDINEDFKQAWYELNEKYKQLRSALEEIREIADKCKECLNEDDDCGCDYLRIKRKIDEVLK